MIVNKVGVSFWRDEENVLKLIVVMFAQLCECIKNVDMYIFEL